MAPPVLVAWLSGSLLPFWRQLIESSELAWVLVGWPQPSTQPAVAVENASAL